MTKTLTEQWREGKLPDGYYYIDYDTQQRIFEIEDGCATYQGLPAETYFLNDVCLIKVLATVPSYDKWKQMIDGDKSTIHHLKKILPMIEYNRVAYDYLKKVIEDMETDIKGVK